MYNDELDRLLTVTGEIFSRPVDHEEMMQLLVRYCEKPPEERSMNSFIDHLENYVNSIQ